MKRRLLIGAVATVLLSAAAAWWWFSPAPQDSPLMLTGNVEVRQVNLGFKVAGRIKGLKVDEGDTITEGQVLAGLERVYFEDEHCPTQGAARSGQSELGEAGSR